MSSSSNSQNIDPIIQAIDIISDIAVNLYVNSAIPRDSATVESIKSDFIGWTPSPCDPALIPVLAYLGCYDYINGTGVDGFTINMQYMAASLGHQDCWLGMIYDALISSDVSKWPLNSDDGRNQPNLLLRFIDYTPSSFYTPEPLASMVAHVKSLLKKPADQNQLSRLQAIVKQVPWPQGY